MNVSLIKACFRSPALSSPLWGPMWRQLPRAPDVFLSFLHTVPHDHTSGWAPGANKSPAGSPARLYISKNTRVRFPQQDWSVSPIKMNTHSSFSSSSWSPAQMCVIHNTCRKISEKSLVLPSICFVRATFEWQTMLFGPDNVVLTSTSRG